MCQSFCSAKFITTVPEKGPREGLRLWRESPFTSYWFYNAISNLQLQLNSSERPSPFNYLPPLLTAANPSVRCAKRQIIRTNIWGELESDFSTAPPIQVFACAVCLRWWTEALEEIVSFIRQKEKPVFKRMRCWRRKIVDTNSNVLHRNQTCVRWRHVTRKYKNLVRLQFIGCLLFFRRNGNWYKIEQFNLT